MEGILRKMLGRDNLIHISKRAWILKRHKIYLTTERGEQRTLHPLPSLHLKTRQPEVQQRPRCDASMNWYFVDLTIVSWHSCCQCPRETLNSLSVIINRNETASYPFNSVTNTAIIQLDDLGWLACRLLVVFTNRTAVSLWSFLGEGSVWGVERGWGKQNALLRDFKSTDVADRRAWPYGQEW